jgi:hypothetical protein
MMRALLILAAVALGGCSTLNKYGIGGPPKLGCNVSTGQAYLIDPIFGPDEVVIAAVRRFQDVDDKCHPKATTLERAPSHAPSTPLAKPASL